MNMLKKITQHMCVLLQKENILFWYFVLRFYGEKRNVFHQNVSFLGFNLSIVDGPSFLWQFSDIFRDKAYACVPRHTKPVIYDCGANIGLVSLYYAREYPTSRIVAFEADTKIASVAKQNLVQNEAERVVVIPKAVWIDDRGVSFAPDGADGGSMYGEGEKQKVSSVRLRDYLEKEAYVDMLKIDIEGSEVEVLTDCEDQLPKVDALFVEYHSFTRERQELSRRKQPFVDYDTKDSMDLQVNIYAQRTNQHGKA